MAELVQLTFKKVTTCEEIVP